MSTKKQRGRLADIVMRESRAYAGALTAAGHEWFAASHTDPWPVGSELSSLHGRCLLARECAAAGGLSLKKQRGLLEDITMREFQTYAGALTAAGADWSATWQSDVGPVCFELSWLRGRFLLALECAHAGGLPLSSEEIVRLYRAHLAYRELFPAGMPSLTDH
ncbi:MULTISPECIES: hypothetical protein [unclassified Streptomyces]|uniref:hypothetical protein n=1 Tax=unclassified Streptomyces TaxID=2593676 RepID=UPI0035DE13C1